jgi:hypothetical protein
MPGGFGDNRGLLLLAARHYIGLTYCFCSALLCSALLCSALLE